LDRANVSLYRLYVLFKRNRQQRQQLQQLVTCFITSTASIVDLCARSQKPGRA